MIEVVFNSSAAGSLKVAQRFGKGSYPGSAMSVFLCHEDGTPATEEELEKARKEAIEKERLAWERAVPLGGSLADVFCFELALSMGTFLEDVFSIQRQAILAQMLYHDPDDTEEDIKKSVYRMQGSLKQIAARMKNGEAVRIWYSNQPDELCGFYWFMDWLNHLEADEKTVIFVKLPEWESGENGEIIQRVSFGEVTEDAWYRYLSLQETASPGILQMCSMHWKRFVQENAPLRAMLNGRLVSVSEDIYDSFIRREIDALPEQFYEAKLIGNVFGYQLGISDFFIHSRIEQMISAGALEPAAPAEEGMPPYRRLLRKIHEID